MEVLCYILIFFILFVSIKMFLESDIYNLKCIVSSVDGNKYCVRERKNLQKTADLLAKVTGKMKRLVDITSSKYGTNKKIQNLKKNFNPKKIKEILPTSSYTAYSENKGEKIAFCTTKTKNGSELIDENTLTFVAIHELAHVMSDTVGHTKEFWDNFKFLLKKSVEYNLYDPVNYGETPKTYCDMEINDNPYFDKNTQKELSIEKENKWTI